MMLLVKRHPLISFIVLAYALSWWIWILYASEITFLGPIFALGPFLAAIIVTALTRGTAGLKALLSRMVRWRVGLKWYAAALGLPVAVYLFALSLNLLFGARASTAEQFGSWYLIFPLFAYSLLFPLSGAFGEELGWRGYAVPRVQARLSALSAALIIGVVQTAWHLPLFMTDCSASPVPLIVRFMGLGILATWVFNNTAGSVLLTMMLHASFNTNAGFFGEMFAGADLVRMSWLLAAGWCVAAIVVFAAAGPAHLSRNHHKQEDRATSRGEQGRIGDDQLAVQNGQRQRVKGVLG
jgi:membrane protease YdiL (CAAX protease family)